MKQFTITLVATCPQPEVKGDTKSERSDAANSAIENVTAQLQKAGGALVSTVRDGGLTIVSATLARANVVTQGSHAAEDAVSLPLGVVDVPASEPEPSVPAPAGE